MKDLGMVRLFITLEIEKAGFEASTSAGLVVEFSKGVNQVCIMIARVSSIVYEEFLLRQIMLHERKAVAAFAKGITGMCVFEF